MLIYYFLDPYNVRAPATRVPSKFFDEKKAFHKSRRGIEAFKQEKGIVEKLEHMYSRGNVHFYMIEHEYRGKFYPIVKSIGTRESVQSVVKNMRRVLFSLAEDNDEELNIIKTLEFVDWVQSMWSEDRKSRKRKKEDDDGYEMDEKHGSGKHPRHSKKVRIDESLNEVFPLEDEAEEKEEKDENEVQMETDTDKQTQTQTEEQPAELRDHMLLRAQSKVELDASRRELDLQKRLVEATEGCFKLARQALSALTAIFHPQMPGDMKMKRISYMASFRQHANLANEQLLKLKENTKRMEADVMHLEDERNSMM